LLRFLQILTSKTGSPAESAEALAEAFSPIFVHEPEDLPSVVRPDLKSEADILGDINIKFDKVKHEPESLDCIKSYSPDFIENFTISTGYQIQQ
jgi:hypothetical protein